MWCDQAKSVWSRSNSVFIFLTIRMHHFHSYILQKTPLKLVNWFQRYEQLKDATNNRKQNTFCLVLSSNQYFRLPIDFAWSHHIYEKHRKWCSFGLQAYCWTSFKLRTSDLSLWFQDRNDHLIGQSVLVVSQSQSGLCKLHVRYHIFVLLCPCVDFEGEL